MPTGAENVRSWGQTGSGPPMFKTALLTDAVEKIENRKREHLTILEPFVVKKLLTPVC
jgi:hypothetical protein